MIGFSCLCEVRRKIVITIKRILGKLRAEVRDWDGKLVVGSEVESLAYGKYRVTFNPPAPGKYNIYLYWSEIAVQSAYPLHAIADAQQSSTSRSVPIATKTG